jgi:hypothetical protein
VKRFKNDLFPLILLGCLSTTSPVLCGNAFTISTTLPSDLHSASSIFSKYVEVFGLRVLATSSVSDAKVLHTANVMAEYLDNDEDGLIDQPEVLNSLVGTSNTTISTMVLFASETEQNSLDSTLAALEALMSRTQNLFADEIFEDGSQGENRDATLEEVLHLVTDKGWDEAFPAVWGESKGSSIANAMDTARGGYYETVPAAYPASAWYTYNDQTSDYPTQITEYVYWATTTYLGGQNWNGRIHSNFTSEWKPKTQAELNATDPAVVSLLTSSSYKFPVTQLPDGNYSGANLRAQASTTSISGWKSSSWFGYFYDPGSTWIYHQHLGWLYTVESGSNGIWLYHSSYGWMWTKSTAYPWIYFYSLSGWRYFLAGKGFYKADTGSWTAVESFSVETSGTTNNDNSTQTGYGDENSSTVWSSTANASVSLSHATSNGNSVMTLTSNLYPNWNITGESGHYATTPSAQNETVEIILHPNSTASFHTELVVYNPTFSDVAYIGRPDNSLPDYTHWDSSTPPKELLAVDMLSVEAYDMTSSHGANGSYTGKLRFNVHYIGDNGLTGVTWQNGTIPLSNDYFNAHTQPTGEYHLHGFKAGMEFDYSNKIIGYALDGHAVMGRNTKTYQPVMDSGNILSGYDASAETKPALSGYALVETSKLVEIRGANLSTTNFPAGIFHVDHEYVPTVAADSYSLDKYNMGYVMLTDKDGTQRVEKAYVQTQTYPYLVHTLYGANNSATNSSSTQSNKRRQSPRR